MTNEERAAVKKAIMDRTTEWAEANRRRDPDAVLDLFDDSDELRHAENGAIFPSYAALSDFVNEWYETADEMGMSWEERQVYPLAPDAATMTGIFKFEARQKSGEVFAGRNVFTGVFVKRGDSWRLIHGHESTVPSPESEHGSDQ